MAAPGGPGTAPGPPPAPLIPPSQFSFSAIPPFNPQPQKGTTHYAKKSSKASQDLDNEENFFVPPPTSKVALDNPVPNQSHSNPKGATQKISFRDTLMGGQSMPSSVLVNDLENLLIDDSYNTPQDVED